MLIFPKSITTVLLIVFTAIICGCEPSGPEVIHVQARPAAPTEMIGPGEHTLGLGGPKLINGLIYWRDGTLYIPKNSSSRASMPLLVWLHGGGGHASHYRYLFPLAEEFGVVIVTLDSRHNTWDGIDSPFGPDVMFIDAAMQYTFESVNIDPQRIALGGLSDGAAYALALGRTNGDLFTHLIAVAPGRLDPPGPPTGQPKILVAHGTRDNVYNVAGSRRYIVPKLKDAGYDVSYLEFDGPHSMHPPIARQVLKWFTQ